MFSSAFGSTVICGSAVAPAAKEVIYEEEAYRVDEVEVGVDAALDEHDSCLQEGTSGLAKYLEKCIKKSMSQSSSGVFSETK